MAPRRACRARGPGAPPSPGPGVAFPLWTLLAATSLAVTDLATPEDVSAQAGKADPAPLVGDRPDFTESASVVGRLQLETGYTYEDQGPERVHTVGELLVRIPAAGRLELRVEAPSWIREEAPSGAGDGWDLTDAGLGLKLELLEPGRAPAGPAVALLVDTSLPTGDHSASGELFPSARLATGLSLSDRVSLGANAGLASAENGEDRHAELLGSVSLGLAVHETVTAFLEGYGLAPTGGAPSSSVLNGGLTWLAGRHLQLDARLGTGLSGPAPELVLGTGVVWRL